MPDERYRCRWCLRESGHPDDIVNGSCSCCGSDDILLIKPCEHRTGSTLYELFRRGVRLVRREPWPEGDYLELPDHGGFVPPFGLLQRPSARDGAPPDVGYGPGVVPTFRQPAGGWEPYTGPTVEHDRPPTARLEAVWHAPPGDEEYLGLIVNGAVMGAASHGIILAAAEIRRLLLDVAALVRRCA